MSHHSTAFILDKYLTGRLRTGVDRSYDVQERLEQTIEFRRDGSRYYRLAITSPHPVLPKACSHLLHRAAGIRIITYMIRLRVNTDCPLVYVDTIRY